MCVTSLPAQVSTQPIHTPHHLLTRKPPAPKTCVLLLIITIRCDWLNNKNTIFGKIVGDTVYNMLRLNDLEVGLYWGFRSWR